MAPNLLGQELHKIFYAGCLFDDSLFRLKLWRVFMDNIMGICWLGLGQVRHETGLKTYLLYFSYANTDGSLENIQQLETALLSTDSIQ